MEEPIGVTSHASFAAHMLDRVGEPETAAKTFYFCKLWFNQHEKSCWLCFVACTSKRCSIRILKQWVWFRKAAAAVHCGRCSSVWALEAISARFSGWKVTITAHFKHIADPMLIDTLRAVRRSFKKHKSLEP